MSEEKTKLGGPDLAQGVALSSIADGAMLLGHAHGEPVLLVRRGDELFAIGAVCTHYGAPACRRASCGRHGSLSLASCLLQPAHRRGSARAGAEPCFLLARRTARRHGFCPRKAREREPPSACPRPPGMPGSVVIVGGGAAGNAAAETLRREGYAGRITMLSADESVPCDRPNLSKGYLAGTAPEEWIPLRSPEFYEEHGIDLKLGARVAAIDTAKPAGAARGRQPPCL